MKTRTVLLTAVAALLMTWPLGAFAQDAGSRGGERGATSVRCAAAAASDPFAAAAPAVLTAAHGNPHPGVATFDLCHEDCEAFCEAEVVSCLANCNEGGRCRSLCFGQYRNCELNCLSTC